MVGLIGLLLGLFLAAWMSLPLGVKVRYFKFMYSGRLSNITTNLQPFCDGNFNRVC